MEGYNGTKNEASGDGSKCHNPDGQQFVSPEGLELDTCVGPVGFVGIEQRQEKIHAHCFTCNPSLLGA